MFGLKIFFVVNLSMALSFDPRGLRRLHDLSLNKTNFGKKGFAIDPIEKDEITMDTEDLGGNATEFEAAVADMQQEGENTDLLVDNVVNPASNQAFQSPILMDQPEYEPLGPGMFQPDTSMQDQLVNEQFQNRDAIESVTKPSQVRRFLTTQAERLGIGEGDQDSWIANMMDYSQKVRGIESDNNPMASAGTTSAKGVYQFTDASVETGMNRMKNMGWDGNFIGDISTNPHEWDDEQADAMFFANMFAQRGSDEYMRGIGAGEDVGKEAYYKFHHTAPDEATTKRATDFFGY